jgi:dihydrofolate reductase
VITHGARDTLAKKRGTTFTFVTDGIESALDQARTAAGDKNVSVAGGANIVRQMVRHRLVDQLQLHISPVLLGDGMQLFDTAGHEPIEFVRSRVVETAEVMHVRLDAIR